MWIKGCIVLQSKSMHAWIREYLYTFLQLKHYYLANLFSCMCIPGTECQHFHKMILNVISDSVLDVDSQYVPTIIQREKLCSLDPMHIKLYGLQSTENVPVLFLPNDWPFTFADLVSRFFFYLYTMKRKRQLICNDIQTKDLMYCFTTIGLYTIFTFPARVVQLSCLGTK